MKMLNNSTTIAEENLTDHTKFLIEKQLCSLLRQVQKGSDISFTEFGVLCAFISFANAFLAVVAILGNTLIIAAFHRYVQLRTPSNLLLLGLAVCDLLVGLVTQPVFAAEVAFVAANSHVSCALKDLYVIFLFSFSSSSMLHVCLISVERSFAIFSPFKHEHLVTSRNVSVFLVVLWICWTLLAVVTRRDHGGAGISGFSSLGFVTLSAVVVLVINIRLWIEARRHSRKIENSLRSSSTTKNEDKETQAQRKSARNAKAVKTVLLIIGFMVLCNSPFIATFTARKFYGVRGRVITLLWFASNTVVLLPAILNPLTYFWRKRDFRVSVKRMLGLRNAIGGQR